MGSMKVHQLTRGAFWDQHEPSLSLGACKRLRPLAPRRTTTTTTTNAHDSTLTSLDLKTFIKVDHIGPRKSTSNEDSNKRDHHSTHQVEAHSGGTRWNPTQEQIGILEMLYRGGMRTPNAQQIEQITAQLGRYGKIEGKNVFYWFQNHKARERQKQKRNNLGLVHSPRTPPATTIMTSDASGLSGEVIEREELDSPYKRKQRSWGIEFFEEESRICRHDNQDGSDKTLELFPLHPEGR